MRKNKLVLVLILPLLILLPLGKVANAQGPDYVGVRAGDTYTWKAKVEFGNVDNLLVNLRNYLVEFKADLPSFEFFGLEALTIEEIYEQIAVTYLSNVLPTGWESMNITDLIRATIEDYIENFNSTMFSGMIPSNWQTLNFSDFYELAVEGLNTTLTPEGWFDNPLPELYKLTINELNSTIYYGLIPEGWEAMTIEDFITAVMSSNFPIIWESFVFQMMLESSISNFLPADMLDDTLSDLLDQLVASLPPEISTLNASALFEMMFYGLNETMPGIESMIITDLIDMAGESFNSTMPPGYGELPISILITTVIENDLYGYLYPPEVAGMTITEILDMGLTQLISMFDSEIIPGWTETYTMLQGMGMVSYEAGLRAHILSIGAEIEAYSGGPRGVPIVINYSVSMDMEEWIDLSTLFGYSGSLSPSMLLTIPWMFFMGVAPMNPLIVDPSTYSTPQIALSDQMAFTNGLIVADNYNWEEIQTELTFPTSGHPSAIVMSSEWIGKGVLQGASVKADGLNVVSLSLIGAGGEIPGYETTLLLGFASVALIAIIYHVKRKNRITK